MAFKMLSLHSLILALTFFLSTSPQTLANCPCGPPSTPKPPTVGPIPLPPGVVPTVPIPKLPVPPVVVPTVPIPHLPVPPVVVPTVPIPNLPVPPVVGPIVPVLPPVLPKPPSGKPPCTPTPHVKPKPKPTPSPSTKCPVSTLKLGACLNTIVGFVHIGDPAVDCCPLLAGLTSAQAAVCLCTTIKLNALGIKLFLPVALELLVTCGKTPPPGYNCA